MTRKNPKRISAAAILIQGIIFTGEHHGEILNHIKNMLELGRLDNINPHEHFQGFLTNRGEFVDRADAFSIALRAGQIPIPRARKRELFSEDLW